MCDVSSATLQRTECNTFSRSACICSQYILQIPLQRSYCWRGVGSFGHEHILFALRSGISPLGSFCLELLPPTRRDKGPRMLFVVPFFVYVAKSHG